MATTASIKVFDIATPMSPTTLPLVNKRVGQVLDTINALLTMTRIEYDVLRRKTLTAIRTQQGILTHKATDLSQRTQRQQAPMV